MFFTTDPYRLRLIPYVFGTIRLYVDDDIPFDDGNWPLGVCLAESAGELPLFGDSMKGWFRPLGLNLPGT